MSKKTTTRRFSQVYIEITNRCNLTCPFCPRTGRPLADMDTVMFAGIIAEVKPLTEQVYLHVMGEPLVHPNFSRLIRICAEQALPVAITTNGSMLNTDSAKSLLDPIVRRINISLDALGSGDKYQFEQIISFTRLAFEQRPDLYINYRLWNLAFSSEALESDSNRQTCRRIEDAFGITIPPQGHSSGRKSLHLLNRLYLHLDTRFTWPEIDGSRPQNTNGFCHALSSHFAILVDGTIVPCCLDHDGVTALGNCRKQSLNSILASPKASAIAKGFSEGRLIESLCRQCAFISRFASRAQRTNMRKRRQASG